MNENRFIDHVNNAIESIANYYGAGPLVGWFRRVILKGEPVDYLTLQNDINTIMAANRSKGQKVLDDISNKINRLRQIVPSVATKDVIEKALSAAKKEYNAVNSKLNLAEAYENSANSLANQLSYMSENQRMSTQAKSFEDEAKDKLSKAEDVYRDIASNYEKQNEIGGENNV